MYNNLFMITRKRVFYLYWLAFLLLSVPGRVVGTEWQQLRKGLFHLYCHSRDVKNGEQIIAFAESAIDRIASDLGIVPVKKIRIIIADSEKTFADITDGQIPEWGIGASDPVNAIIFLQSPRFARAEKNLKQIVIHELSHILLGMALNGIQIDRWFDEGFAQLESGESVLSETILLARAFRTDEILSLDQIEEVLTFHREKASLAYLESRSALDYLIDQNGREIIAKIINRMKVNMDLDVTFQEVIGVNLQDFQDNWILSAKKKYRWYIMLEFPVILSIVFVVMFLMAFFITRIRMEKKRRLWENEELDGFQKMEKDTTSV